MPTGRKKHKVVINNDDSLQGLMQETYNDACLQITESQRAMNELTASAGNLENVDDIVKISKAKSDLLKNKDSAIKIKLEMCKIQSDIVKNRGTEDPSAKQQNSGPVTLADFQSIREMLKAKPKEEENEQ